MHHPILKSTGYDTVIVHFTTPLGPLKIVREIDSKKIKIECSNPRIDTTKEYNCESGHKNWIGKVFNVILGFDEDFKIPKSNDGKMQRFSWKLLSNAYMINERRTENATILSPY